MFTLFCAGQNRHFTFFASSPLSVEKCPKYDRIFLESHTLFWNLTRLKALLNMMKKSIKQNVVEKVKLYSDIFSMTILNYCVFIIFSLLTRNSVPDSAANWWRRFCWPLPIRTNVKCKPFLCTNIYLTMIFFCPCRCKTYSLIVGADRHAQTCR